MHMWIASGKHSSKKMLSDPQKRALNQIWTRAYKDSRLFAQKRIAITQAEIGKLLAVGVLYKAGGVAIVPADPTKVLSQTNSAVVATSTRILLMTQWKRFGEVEYCKLLRESNGSEETISETRSLTLGQPCN
jgi:hypothetical protein